MAQEVIFAERTLDAALNPNNGLYYMLTSGLVLTAGQTYSVVWDGETHVCTAQEATLGTETGIALGNLGILGLGDLTEIPFVIGAAEDGSGLIYTTDTSAAHTVAIYTIDEGTEEAYNPNDAIILSYSQNPDLYEKIPKVWLTHPSSTEEAPVLVPFTYGEAVSKEVGLDFSSGDNMEVPIAYGELITDLTIVKPADLVPEKIAAGEYIAGVGPGTHTGGGFELDSILKYFMYQIDMENNKIYLSAILYSALYADTGSCDITIPNKISGYDVVIACEVF